MVDTAAQDEQAIPLYVAGLAIPIVLLIISCIGLSCSRWYKCSGLCGDECCCCCGGDSHSYNLHMGWTRFYIFNIFLTLIVMPCLFHMSLCAMNNYPTGCSWSLKASPFNKNPPSGTLFGTFDIEMLPGVTFGLIALILEMCFSLILCVISIRWATPVMNKETDRDGFMAPAVETSAELEDDYSCSLNSSRKWLRLLTFWTFFAGTIARIFVYGMLHGSFAHDAPYMDAFIKGEGIVVIVVTVIHWFCMLGMCCKRTFGEDHLANPDYTAFICGSCGGARCEVCHQRGIVFEDQGLHHGPVMVN